MVKKSAKYIFKPPCDGWSAGKKFYAIFRPIYDAAFVNLRYSDWLILKGGANIVVVQEVTATFA